MSSGKDHHQDDSNPEHEVPLQPGQRVAWNWGRGHVEGTIQEVHTDHVEKESKGKTITRNGTEDNPAYFITGPKNPVLKKDSEVVPIAEDEHPAGKVETRRQHEMHDE